MNHRKKLVLAPTTFTLFVIVCSLAACDVSLTTPASRERSVVMTSAETLQSLPGNTATTSTDATCPAQDAEQFVLAFADSVELQKLFTAQPLQMDSIDATAELEPKQVTKRLSGVDIPFPVMPGLAMQRVEGLEMLVTLPKEHEAVVVLQKPDTDYRMSFYFRRGGCWILYRVRNDSI